MLSPSFCSSTATKGQFAGRPGKHQIELLDKNQLSASLSSADKRGCKRVNLFRYAALSLIVLSFLIQCASSEDEKAGHPCICNGEFYMECPKAKECEENSTKKPIKIPVIDEDLDSHSADLHDDSHPDHVDIPPFFGTANDGLLNDPTRPTLPPIDRDRIIRHRKVYVTRKEDDDQMIKPISITIPLKVKDDDWPLPKPKPVFKYKKYMTYETKPEIQMVPVTKTIIRPVGVTTDQIVDENGEKVSKDFDAKKL